MSEDYGRVVLGFVTGNFALDAADKFIASHLDTADKYVKLENATPQKHVAELVKNPGQFWLDIVKDQSPTARTKFRVVGAATAAIVGALLGATFLYSWIFGKSDKS